VSYGSYFIIHWTIESSKIRFKKCCLVQFYYFSTLCLVKSSHVPREGNFMADALPKQGVKRICELVAWLWYLILPSLFESICDLHGNLVSLTFVAGAGIWLHQNSAPQTYFSRLSLCCCGYHGNFVAIVYAMQGLELWCYYKSVDIKVMADWKTGNKSVLSQSLFFPSSTSISWCSNTSTGHSFISKICRRPLSDIVEKLVF